MLPTRHKETNESDLPTLTSIYANDTLAGKDMSRLLEAVFKTYDKRIRPFYDGKYKNELPQSIININLWTSVKADLHV